MFSIHAFNNMTEQSRTLILTPDFVARGYDIYYLQQCNCVRVHLSLWRGPSSLQAPSTILKM